MKRLLVDLPDDLLIAILSFCDIKSLGRVVKTCKKFHNLTKNNSVWKTHYINLTCIHYSCHPREFDKKSKRGSYLPLREFCRLSFKWKLGKANVVAVKHYDRQLPWIQLDSDNCLWISNGNKINAYKVSVDGNIRHNAHVSFKCDIHDVNRFSLKNNTLVVGCRDGSAACFNKHSKCVEFHLKNVHRKEIQAVDVVDDESFVTGSFDQTVKIFNKHCGCKEVATLPLGDRVLSLASLGQFILAVGTAGVKHFKSPISLWDIQRTFQVSFVGQQFKHGAGILDMKCLNSNVLVTSDYDSFVKVWDLRLPSLKSVISFEDPSDSAVYCIALDYKNAVLSGSARSSQSFLWDFRLPRKHVQMYHFKSSSPVYSLAFTPTYLLMALDDCLTKISFNK